MTPNRKFNLLRQFGMFSFIAILLLAVITGYLLSHFITEKLLWREATLTQDFVNSIVQTDQIYRYITNHDSEVVAPELKLFFDHMANLPDVVRTKVFDKDKNLLFDSLGSGSLDRAEGNDELVLSLQGNLVTEFGLSRSQVKEEHKDLPGGGEDIHFIETYVPLWNADYSAVVGAIELYKEPRILHEAIIDGRYLVWGIALIGAALLFSCLFWIVYRANRIIQHQQLQLVENESLSMIGETASAVAHAMRNALASIRASAELTLDDDLEGARESARDIMGEADRLNRWAGELLKFSSDGGDGETVFDISLIALLENVIDEHRLVFQKRKISLNTEFDGRQYLVKANAAQLAQVFGNLIMNAVEAMESDGELKIQVYSTADEMPRAIIDFVDNGPGLSQEIIGQLFKPFATTKPSGTGLGLALTRRMLNRYDGRISIHSEPAQGVTARVELPLRAPAA